MRATIDFQAALLTRKQQLLSDIQTRGLRLVDPKVGAASRIGGAGPTDHKAVTILGTTIMVPVHTYGATQSPYVAMSPDSRGISILHENDDCLVKWVVSATKDYAAMQARTIACSSGATDNGRLLFLKRLQGRANAVESHLKQMSYAANG